MNLINMTSLAMSLRVAQWLERPSGVREVMGSILVGHSDFFFVPRSWHIHLSTIKLYLGTLWRRKNYAIILLKVLKTAQYNYYFIRIEL